MLLSKSITYQNKTISLLRHRINSCAKTYISILISMVMILSLCLLNGCEADTVVEEGRDSTKKVIVQTGLDCATTDATTGVALGSCRTITVDDIRACSGVEDYLDLVMPCYQSYSAQYGIKYPGVMALQSIYETGVPNNIAHSLEVDNNMGGLKYGEGIPNATPGTAPNDGTGGVYSHFQSVDQYIEASIWNVTNSGYYSKALAATTMEDFAVFLIRVWVGGSDNAGDSYAHYVIKDYEKYNLAQYEGISSGAKVGTSAPAVTSTGVLLGDTVEDQVWNYFKSQGFSDAATAGIMGNVKQESDFKPDCLVWADGLFQFERDTGEAKEQKDYAASKGKPWTDVAIQCEFVLNKLPALFKQYTGFGKKYVYYNNDALEPVVETWWPEPMTLEEFKQLTDPALAAEIFERVFERPSLPRRKNRRSFAQDFYEQYAGTGGATVQATEECSDASKYSGVVGSSSAGVQRGAQFHQVQGNDKNCGATAFIVGINILLNQELFTDNVAAWQQMDSDTTTIGWDGGAKGNNFLKKNNLDSKIEVTECHSINDKEKLKQSLAEGNVCIVSSQSSVFRRNDGSLHYSGGHYILIYKYENGNFYVNDSASNAELCAGVQYSESDMDRFFNAPGRTGGSISIRLR